MNNSGSTAAELQEKIAAARREAETLKEKIRAKRDQLADTSCELLSLSLAPLFIPAWIVMIIVLSTNKSNHSRIQ